MSDRTGWLEVARWRGNLDIALDGAGVRPANSDHRDSPLCKVTTD